MRAYKKRLGIQRLIMSDAIDTIRESIPDIPENDISLLLEKSLEQKQWGYRINDVNFNLITIKPRKGTNLSGECTSDFAWNVNFVNTKEMEKAICLIGEVNLGYNIDGKEMRTSKPRLNIWKKDYSQLTDRQFSVIVELIKKSVKNTRK